VAELPRVAVVQVGRLNPEKEILVWGPEAQADRVAQAVRVEEAQVAAAGVVRAAALVGEEAQAADSQHLISVIRATKSRFLSSIFPP
jgi:hypothetical protein